ncbi:SigE family RNA polymerase sigma factor [Actinoplanes solisilvae]|uniref:SigE family RNA polymerase sigma factor n=1 Tax=Actinoplanes solisilvae TaxID=2486853 RepID=UPI000FDAFD81|nr:SigE family RNA polymerase sigma factor [Actinoplanes solisilvae]
MTDTVTTPRPADDVRVPRTGKAARDEEFTQFVESAATRLRRSAFLMCRDWHLAQDLTQQTFTKMYAVWKRIRTGTNLDAYSRRVLMNLVFDQQKRRSGSEIVLAEMPEHPDGGSGLELHLTLVDALARLTVDDRAVLVLRHAEDQSVDTVATILGISVSAVKMRDARALARLRSLLGDDFLDQ